jgi:hypothetical protein
LFRNQTFSLEIEKNGGRLFRRPKLTLNCSAEEMEGMNEEFLTGFIKPRTIPNIFSKCILQDKIRLEKEQDGVHYGNHSSISTKIAHLKFTESLRTVVYILVYKVPSFPHEQKTISETAMTPVLLIPFEMNSYKF